MLRAVDLESIVQQILLTRRDLTREQVLKLIYEKKRSAEDYFLDEVAARIVATELGVEIETEEETFTGEVAIKHLVSGLNDVTTIARVIAVYPVQVFSRSDLTEGKVARLQLADKTGIAKLVLWNDKIELVEAGKIQQGQIVRVLHAYVREGFDGNLELHLGTKGNLEVSPQNVDEKLLPRVADLMDKIGQLTPKKKKANVAGLVTQVFPVSEFTRKDGTQGKVRRLRIRDETAETTLVFWNEKADEVNSINEDNRLRIVNARVKTGLDGRLELHVENSTQISRMPNQATPTTGTRTQITHVADLKEEGGPFTIEAVVTSTPDLKEVTTAQNEKVLLASFDLEDDTGKIAVTLWRRHAELAKELTAGTRIRLRNAFVKRGFSNLLELVSRGSTKIEVVPKPESLHAENKIE